MATNLVKDIQNALQINIPQPTIYGWLDSTEIISPSLTWIFNLSIETGIYVEEWEKAWVLTISKTEDRQKWENYRPISILPIISKIFERSVFNQLYKYLNENSLLSKYQSGFRPKNSTLSALLLKCAMLSTLTWITET